MEFHLNITNESTERMPQDMAKLPLGTVNSLAKTGAPATPYKDVLTSPDVQPLWEQETTRFHPRILQAGSAQKILQTIAKPGP